MNILRVACIPGHRAGGMARYIHMVSDQLQQAGHTVEHVFSPDVHRNAKSLGYLDRFLTTYRAERAIRKLIVSGKRYDVVDIHEPIAAYYAWKRRRNPALPPLLVSVYGLEVRSHLARLDYLKKKGLPINLKVRYSPLSVVWQANYSLRNADHITVETTEDVEYLQHAMKIPAEKITQQIGGASEHYFAARSSHPKGILYVGTWIDRKGVPELVAAFMEVARSNPAITLTVAGPGVPNETVLQAFPAELRDRILFAPSTDNDHELAAIYQSHAMFVLPSTFEGLPLVMVEAAAAGLPIITTAVCGMRDMIRHEENGLIVPIADAKALSDSIRRLLEDSSLALRLGEAARETARRYTWERSAEQYLEACRAAERQS